MAADDTPEVAARRNEQRLLTELVADLRGSDRLTAPELVRLDRVRMLLAARNIPLRDGRAALWLAPVICTSSSQQSRFLERFATLFDVPVETLRPAPPEPPVVPETPRPPWWRRHARLLAFAGAAALIVAWLVWRTPRQGDPAAVEAVTLQGVVRVVLGDAPAGTMTTAVAWLMVASFSIALLAALAAGHRLWRRARKAREKEEFEPRHIEARSLAFAAALPRLYASPRLRHRLGGLRRHRIVPSPRIHVRRSIRATIKAGGRPVLVHGTRPVTPDYVLLADRESPRDHLPVVAQILSKRFSEEGVAAAAYDYFGDPRRVRRTFPLQEEAELSIERVAGRHNGARLLVLAEPAHCLDSSGRAAPWLADLPEERPVLLDPRGEARWDWRLEEIAGAGVQVFPASPAGIGEYADSIQARAGEALARRPQASGGRVDLPALLDRHRDALIGETAPEEGEVRDLLDDLELWLGAEAMVVLRAAAVFPLVEPSLTVLLASRLVDSEGKALLTENRLLALARLPWLRIGRIPAWLRGPLARGLTGEQLAVALSTIHAFLNPVEDGPKGRLKLDFTQADDPAARERLLDWLRRNPTSPYGDSLLLDAVGGRPPDQLGLHLDPEPVQRLRTALRKVDPARDGVALVLSGVAAVALAVLMPAEQPVTPPSDEPARKIAEGPGEQPGPTGPETVDANSGAEVPPPDAEAPKGAPAEELAGPEVTTNQITANLLADVNATDLAADDVNAAVVNTTGFNPTEEEDVTDNAQFTVICDRGRGTGCQTDGVNVILATIPITNASQLGRLETALDEAIRSLSPSAGESLDVVVLVKATRSLQLPRDADAVEIFARRVLSARFPPKGVYLYNVRQADQEDRRAPNLSVRILKVRRARATAD